jgi:hypothetical protein
METTDRRESDNAYDSKGVNAPNEPRSGRLRTGLLIVGSALFGGIAVALWNRRTLTKMQNPAPEKGQKQPAIEDDAIY